MKGKYAARAANRTASAEQEANEAAYRRRILKLTEERDEARNERDAARAEWAKEVRILRAQLAEGTSPRVEALNRELNRLREERDQLGQWKKESRKKYGSLFDRLVHHFGAVHGMRWDDAANEVTRLYEGVDPEMVIVNKGVEKKFATKYGPEALEVIRRSRRDGAVVSNESVFVEGPTS